MTGQRRAIVEYLFTILALLFAIAVAHLVRSGGPMSAPGAVPPIPVPAPPQPGPAATVADQGGQAIDCGPRRLRLHLNQPVYGSLFHCPYPLHWRHRDLRITIAPMATVPSRPASEGMAIVTLRRHGLPRQVVRVQTDPVWGIEIAVGRLDRSGSRFVMVQSFTGGPHCCATVHIVVPEGAERGVSDLGAFDIGMMDGMDPMPRDVDGDGRTDFVILDNRFLYEFMGYSGTPAPPPRIWNFRRGRAVEVSAAARYLPLFQAAYRDARDDCLQSDDVSFVAFCPGYVASAARLGRFVAAWREMLGRYDPARHDMTVNEHFTDHLRRFLRHNGYLTS